MAGIIEQLAEEFKVRKAQVENVVRLIDEGNTIPFIARYRKEMTGELNDQVLREINDRLQYLRNLDERKTAVKRLIDEQGKLSDEIVNAWKAAIAGSGGHLRAVQTQEKNKGVNCQGKGTGTHGLVTI